MAVAASDGRRPMTRSIETEFPRTLLLQNVASLRLNALEPTEVNRAAAALSRFIRGSGAAPVGPLIQRVGPSGGSAEDRADDILLMRQADAPLTRSVEIAVDDRLEVPGCVLARFRGDASDIDVVYSKITVVAYENDVVLEGTVHLVFAGEDGMTIAVDAFASTLEAGSHAGR
jgi:hypothetical protein